MISDLLAYQYAHVVLSCSLRPVVAAAVACAAAAAAAARCSSCCSLLLLLLLLLQAIVEEFKVTALARHPHLVGIYGAEAETAAAVLELCSSSLYQHIW
jgi:hypothetical protein